MSEKPKVSGYGMTAKCRKIQELRETCEGSLGGGSRTQARAMLHRAVDLLLAVEWCKANECEFTAMDSPITGKWDYMITTDCAYGAVHNETATVPMAAVRQMQKLLAVAE